MKDTFSKQYTIFGIKVLFRKEALDESTLHINTDIMEEDEAHLMTMHTICLENTEKPIT